MATKINNMYFNCIKFKIAELTLFFWSFFAIVSHILLSSFRLDFVNDFCTDMIYIDYIYCVKTK